MRWISRVALFVLVVASIGQQQTAQTPKTSDASPASTELANGMVINCALDRSLDAKKLQASDPVLAHVTYDLKANGKAIIPKGSKVIGHVTSVSTYSKGAQPSTIGIAFDKAILKNGQELPLQVALQAAAPPRADWAAGGPTEIGITKSGGPEGMSGGVAGPDQLATGGGSVGGKANPGGGLPATTYGLIGMNDLQIEPATGGAVLTSTVHNVHLDGGTQLLLRVSHP